MNPDPMPDATCSPERVPKKRSNGVDAVRCIRSVCTVTTEGATFVTASVMAVRREMLIAWSDVGSRAGCRCALGWDCASDGLGFAPSQAASARKSAGPRRWSARGTRRITWPSVVWRDG